MHSIRCISNCLFASPRMVMSNKAANAQNINQISEIKQNKEYHNITTSHGRILCMHTISTCLVNHWKKFYSVDFAQDLEANLEIVCLIASKSSSLCCLNSLWRRLVEYCC